MIKLNRIGNKLGLVGLLGVVLAGGMLVNQMMSEAAVEAANKRAAAQQSIALSSIGTGAAVRRMQVGLRDIRLAKSAQDVEKASGGVAEGHEAGNKHLDSALSKVVRPENRERFEKVKSLVDAYKDVAAEMKQSQLKIFENTAARNNASAEWGNTFAAMTAAPALAAAANRLEIEKAMYEADTDFNALRAATWRFAQTEEDGQKAAIEQRTAALVEAMVRLKALTSDKSISAAVEKLAANQKTFVGLTKEIMPLETVKKEYAAKALVTANQTVGLVQIAGEAAKKLSSEADAAAVSELSQANRLSFIAAVMVMLLLVGSVIFTFIGVARPLTLLNGALGKMAGGELNVDVPGASRGDEVGDIAKAAVVFKDNGLAKIRMEQEQKEAEKRNAAQRKADMSKMADDFEGAVGEIIETVSSASTELEASAGTLTKTAERAQQVTTTVAAASEEASTNVQSVASATEELTSSVNEISRQVQESSRMANAAVDQARKTNDRVGELSKAAARIGDVVELINTIAGQTNLLALNATIEAARAGEAGRGFAVVASEVKALAEQTAKATGDIGQQIGGIQAATQESVNAIREISGTIEKLSEISATIASAVEEQGAATQEISRNVQQAAQGTQQVSSNITDVQRGATETGSASSQVLSAAQSLSRDSNRLKLEVGKFLNTVRAA